MGNQLAQPQKLQSDHLAELPNVVLKDNLGGGRFLKTALCVHDDGGLVVVKVYYKRDDSPNLQKYEDQLLKIRDNLSQRSGPAESHVWPFQKFLQTDKAVYLMRQHVFSNLHDRLSTRPFLSDMEKRWLVFQLLHAVAHIHSQGVVHGDIKCENCLVASWNWLFLTDFASYKPTYLPADNPADFSFFFDTGGRRRCYVAPERFYESSAHHTPEPDQPPSQTMDIFSLGCSIAEIFLEKALFDLSQLLAYRKGEHSPASALSDLNNDIQEMVLHMIQRTPEDRLTAKEYLENWGRRIFPDHFQDSLHEFFYSLLTLSSDERVEVLAKQFPSLRGSILKNTSQAHGHRDGSTVTSSHGPGALTPIKVQERAEQSAVGPEDNTSTMETAAGAEGTGSSRWPPSAATEDLLKRVGALLSSSEALEAHLTSDIDFEPCEPPSDQIQAPVKREYSRHGSAACMESGMVGEVATDTFYEYQLRDPAGQFHEVAGNQAHTTSGPHRKEDLQLPLEGDWHWVGSWEVSRAPSCDSDGWVYRPGGGTVAADPSNSSSHTWTSKVTPECLWRRRCWERKRRRSAVASASLPDHRGPPHRQSIEKGKCFVSVVSHVYNAGCPRESQCEGMVLLTALLCTLLRAARFQDSKMKCLALLSHTSALCDDDTRLQRVVPFLLSMVGDPFAMVRAGAVDALTVVLASVEHLPPSDAKIFPEYVFPGLSMLPSDSEEVVRIAYANNLCQLATVAHSVLTRVQYSQHTPGQSSPGKPSGTRSLLDEEPAHLVAYDADIASVRDSVERVVLELITGPKSTEYTKKALMPHIAGLAQFLGRRRANDFLLPLLITCLNTKNWQLTAALFENIGDVGPFTGKHSLDSFLMPCLEEALKSEEEGVVWQALDCLARVVCCRQLQRRAVLKSALQVVPRLTAATASIRAAACTFIVAAAEVLSPADSYSLLLPAVEKAIGAAPVSLDNISVLVGCLPSVAQPPGSSLSGHSLPFLSGESKDNAQAPSTPWRGLAGVGLSRARVDWRAPGQPSPVDSTGFPVYAVRVKPEQHDLRDSLLDSVLAAATELSRHQLEQQQSIGTPLQQNQLHDSIEHNPKDWRHHRASRNLNSPGAEALLPHALRLVPMPPSELAASRLTPSTMAAATARLDEKAVAHHHHRNPSAGALLETIGSPSTDQGGPSNRGVSNVTGTDPMDSGWRPRGVLVAHLSEHRRAVNQLAVAPNQSFFVSASNDETVKIWDCRRLERDVSFRSRLTYANQGGKILSATFCEDGDSVASASASGSLHVWRVEYSSRAQGIPDRYTGILTRRQISVYEGALLQVVSMGNLLMYSTQRGGVHALDLRCSQDAWTLPLNPENGLLTRITADADQHSWLLTGSSRGRLDLWDLRFRRCVNSWSHPLKQSVEAMSLAVASHSALGLHNMRVSSRAPLVYIAAGGDEIGLWDLEQGRCHQVLSIMTSTELEIGTNDIPAALSHPSNNESPQNSAQRLRTQELGVPAPRSSGVRAILPGRSGAVLTGGSDKCLRFWNAKAPEESYIVSGVPIPGPAVPVTNLGASQAPVRRQYIQRTYNDIDTIIEVSGRSSGSVPLPPDGLQSPPSGQADLNNQSSNACHHDSILGLAYAEVNDRLLLSCSRDGIIKAWK